MYNEKQGVQQDGDCWVVVTDRSDRHSFSIEHAFLVYFRLCSVWAKDKAIFLHKGPHTEQVNLTYNAAHSLMARRMILRELQCSLAVPGPPPPPHQKKIRGIWNLNYLCNEYGPHLPMTQDFH